MVQFTINSFSNGLTGRPYNSIKDAIQDGGSYSVWCNEKIKLAFSFGNGIMLRTQPLFCCYGQIGYQVFVYDRERHASTFTYDWERQQIIFSNN